ncbi:MAG: tetratricopeptide repeat protein [Flavobacteriales bacterium]|nr:tetratricopeptide repeat protein [Flavobacteriales bacterium]
MDKLLRMFEKANQEIKHKNVIGFYISVKELFDKLSCDCNLIELTEHKKEMLKEHLSIIEDFPDDIENYELNVSKAYLYLYNENKEKALYYLNIAIDLNQQDDFSYILRSKIEDNENAIRDLTKAIEINPSSSNYYLLAIANSESDIPLLNNEKLEFNWLITQKTISFLSKAIELNPMFIHAYSERGSNYVKINQYNEAIIDYKKCIELGDESYYYYLSIYKNLIEVGKFKESLTYALKTLELMPDLNFIQKDLGNIYYNLSDYQEAIYHYEEFLLLEPNNEKVKNSIEVCRKNRFYEEKKLAAITAFEKCDYHSCISIFNEIIDSKYNYDMEFSIFESIYYQFDLKKIYLLAILSREGINIQNTETNQIYLELNNLKESGKRKLEEGLELSKDEKNIDKLISYQFFSKLGFGKYENKGINEIIKLNSHYILWCIINLKHFAVENDILVLPQFRNQPLLTLAIEYNLIKNIIIEKWVVEKDRRNYNNGSDYLDSEDYNNSFHSNFYNDDLDMDQQSPEFWDSI